MSHTCAQITRTHTISIYIFIIYMFIYIKSWVIPLVISIVVFICHRIQTFKLLKKIPHFSR